MWAFDARNMKTIGKSLARSLMLVIVAITSGCATSHVSMIGTSQVEIIPQTASRTTNGDIAVEMRFVRGDLGISAIRQDLGPRYAFFSGKAAEGTVRSGISQRTGSWGDSRGTHVNLGIPGFVQTNDVTVFFTTPSWYLWPADWSNAIDHPLLPPSLGLASNSTVQFVKRNNCLWTADLPQDIDGKSYLICIHMFPGQLTKYEDNTRGKHMWVLEGYHLTGDEQHARWGPFIRYPLYIPALAFDIVTIPFQFIHDIGVWGGAMAAMGGH